MQKLSNIRNPRYADAENKTINLDIDIHTAFGDETVVFTATEEDTTTHGQVLYMTASSGAFGAIGDYVEPEPFDEEGK